MRSPTSIPFPPPPPFPQNLQPHEPHREIIIIRERENKCVKKQRVIVQIPAFLPCTPLFSPRGPFSHPRDPTPTFQQTVLAPAPPHHPHPHTRTLTAPSFSHEDRTVVALESVLNGTLLPPPVELLDDDLRFSSMVETKLANGLRG